MQLNILLLPGDGIGVEVTEQAVRVLREVASRFGHELSLTEELLGGIAIKQTGDPFPEETRRLALEADFNRLH
jgi:3-isopropylmalate dehydrogenase